MTIAYFLMDLPVLVVNAIEKTKEIIEFDVAI